MFKVMIVDDNMTNLIMAKKALEDLYEIIPVSSGKIALEFLQEMPEPPDVVLLDVDMPEIALLRVKIAKEKYLLEDVPDDEDIVETSEEGEIEEETPEEEVAEEVNEETSEEDDVENVAEADEIKVEE
jgi:PleD family two-component response regulator